MMSALQKAEQEEDLEHWHFSFRAFCWEGSDPVQALRQLSELCRRWLRPDLLSKEQILDQLVLEQLLITAPEDLQVQVWENRVRSCEELEELLQGRGRPPQASIVVCEGQKFLVRDAEVEMPDPASERDITLDLSTPRWTSERTEEPPASQGVAVAPEDGDPEVPRAQQPPEQQPPPAPGPGPTVTQGGAAGPAAPERDPPRRRPRAARPAPHRCGGCDKAFAYRSQLVIHERSHTGERPYVCERCGRGFVQPSDLRVHGRIHTGERPFRCRLCAKAFAHESTLLGHLRVHTRERPYVCERCGRGFSHRGNLTVHARIHTRAKPYVCPECGRAFRQRGTMKRHLGTHGRASARLRLWGRTQRLPSGPHPGPLH